jgi:hypothetical protein
MKIIVISDTRMSKEEANINEQTGDCLYNKGLH